MQLARFVFFTLTNAPLNWLWQQFLERSFPGYPTSSRVSKQDLEKGGIAKSGTIQGQEGRITKPKLNLRNTFIKWFVDCMCLGALFNTVSFLVMMGLMKGESFELIKKNLETVCCLANDTRPALLLMLYCRTRFRSFWPVTESGRLRR